MNATADQRLECVEYCNQAAHLSRLGANPYFEALVLAVARAQSDPLLDYVVDEALGRCRSFEGRYSDALPHFRAAAKQARPRQQCDGRLSLRLLGLEP